MYERINSVSAKMNHPGYRHIRKFITSFQVQGSRGKHVCIIQETLGITMDPLFSYSNNNSFAIDTVKSFFRHLLICLNFLHKQAGIIHTGRSHSSLYWATRA